MVVFAHIAGMPVEETVASFGPVLLLAGGGCVAALRARLARLRVSPGATGTPKFWKAAIRLSALVGCSGIRAMTSRSSSCGGVSDDEGRDVADELAAEA